MAIWLIRAGSHGEYEQKFISECRVYVTWDKLLPNLANLELSQHFPGGTLDFYRRLKSNRISKEEMHCFELLADLKRSLPAFRYLNSVALQSIHHKPSTNKIEEALYNLYARGGVSKRVFRDFLFTLAPYSSIWNSEKYRALFTPEELIELQKAHD